MFQALLDPVAGNLGLSALVACIPLLTFFIMLLGVKAKAVRLIPLSTYHSETKTEDYGCATAHIFNFEVF